MSRKSPTFTRCVLVAKRYSLSRGVAPPVRDMLNNIPLCNELIWPPLEKLPDPLLRGFLRLFQRAQEDDLAHIEHQHLFAISRMESNSCVTMTKLSPRSFRKDIKASSPEAMMGIQAGGRFVEVDQRRVERYGTGQARPLAHAAGKFAREFVLGVAQPHEPQLHAHDRVDQILFHVAVFPQGE